MGSSDAAEPRAPRAMWKPEAQTSSERGDKLLAGGFDRTAAEIALRAELGRMEYRAVVAEKEAQDAKERLAKREERHAHERELLHRVVADLERELDGARGDPAEVEELRADRDDAQAELDTMRAGLANARAELDHTRAELETAQAELERLRPQLDHFRFEYHRLRNVEDTLHERLMGLASSRWIKLGTRLGLSGLNQHLNRF